MYLDELEKKILSPIVFTDISTQSFTCHSIIAAHFVKKWVFLVLSIHALSPRVFAGQWAEMEKKSIFVKDASCAIVIRVTHSCQILAGRNESPWGNPPDALGTLHAQLTCIQFTENEGDFANAWKVNSTD